VAEKGCECQNRPASAHFPKFVIRLSAYLSSESQGTGKLMILVPLLRLKFPGEFAAGGAGTSNPKPH
jgi:hypothetical protein